jgi:hypothetical protein
MRLIHSGTKIVSLLVLLSFCGSPSPALQTSPVSARPSENSDGSAASSKPSTSPHAATGTEKNADQSASRSASQGTSQPAGGEEPELLGHTNKIPERKDEVYEDWSKPGLTPGMQSEVESLGVTEGNGFTRELLYAQWRDLDPIDLWVIKPAGVKKPPVIFYLYSYPSSNERYKDSDFCKFLTERGFAAVGFVSALTDHRFHDRPLKEWFVSQLPEAMGASAHDVQMTLNFLEKRGDLDMTRVGIWGDGSGASIAILAAAVDPRIKVLDLLNPWGDWPNWLAQSSLVPENERADYLRPVFLKAVENLDPVKWFRQLENRQVRLQYITEGLKVTPLAVRQHIEAAAPANVQLIHYPSTQVFFTDVASTGKGFDWIKQQLGTLTPAEGNGAPTMTRASATVKNSDR